MYDGGFIPERTTAPTDASFGLPSGAGWVRPAVTGSPS